MCIYIYMYVYVYIYIYMYMYIYIYTYTYIYIYVTQRGIWYPSGELGNSSKAIIKGNMKKNMTNELILLIFYEENDEISRNIENFMTIALWEFF